MILMPIALAVTASRVVAGVSELQGYFFTKAGELCLSSNAGDSTQLLAAARHSGWVAYSDSKCKPQTLTPLSRF